MGCEGGREGIWVHMVRVGMDESRLWVPLIIGSGAPEESTDLRDRARQGVNTRPCSLLRLRLRLPLITNCRKVKRSIRTRKHPNPPSSHFSPTQKPGRSHRQHTGPRSRDGIGYNGRCRDLMASQVVFWRRCCRIRRMRSLWWWCWKDRGWDERCGGWKIRSKIAFMEVGVERRLLQMITLSKVIGGESCWRQQRQELLTTVKAREKRQERRETPDR